MDGEVEAIQNLDTQASEIQETKDMIVPARRKNQDVEVPIDGEIVQMPCFSIGLRQGSGLEAEAQSSNDRATGTIEKLTCIAPDSWNKHTRKEYEWNFQPRDVMPSAASNFRKFASSLENRMQTQELIIQHVFNMNAIVTDEDARSCRYKLPWYNF
jgi:hypothetical protein